MTADKIEVDAATAAKLRERQQRKLDCEIAVLRHNQAVEFLRTIPAAQADLRRLVKARIAALDAEIQTLQPTTMTRSAAKFIRSSRKEKRAAEAAQTPKKKTPPHHTLREWLELPKWERSDVWHEAFMQVLKALAPCWDDLMGAYASNDEEMILTEIAIEQVANYASTEMLDKPTWIGDAKYILAGAILVEFVDNVLYSTGEYAYEAIRRRAVVRVAEQAEADARRAEILSRLIPLKGATP